MERESAALMMMPRRMTKRRKKLPTLFFPSHSLPLSLSLSFRLHFHRPSPSASRTPSRTSSSATSTSAGSCRTRRRYELGEERKRKEKQQREIGRFGKGIETRLFSSLTFLSPPSFFPFQPPPTTSLPQKKKGTSSNVGPIMLGFFLFVVVGSALLQIIRTATSGAPF